MAKRILIGLGVAVLFMSIVLSTAILLTPYLSRQVALANPSAISATPTATPTSLPAPTATATPSATPIEGAAFAVTRTDADGKTNALDPFLHTPLVVQMLDADTNAPLPGITTYFVSKGSDLLVVAIDPRRRYLTALRQVTHQKIGRGPFVFSGGIAALPALNGADVFVSMHPLTDAATAADWLALGAEIPAVEHFLPAQDECVNADQIVMGAHTIIGGPVSILPVAPLVAGDARTTPPGDWAWLALRGEITGKIEGAPAQSTLGTLLAAGGGALRFKVYALDRTPTGDRLAVLAGWCLEPLDHASPDSLLKWVEYGMRHGDPYALAQLVADPPYDTVQYGPYRFENQGTLNRETLGREAQAAGLKSAQCLGYAIYRAGERIELFEIFTSNWSAGWDTAQARGTPYAVLAFLPTKRSAGTLATTDGLYLNYVGIPRASDIPRDLAPCPDLLAPPAGATPTLPR
ncbi:MAG: hypothetical protein WCF84_17195 [Anaerolineae bacterium]